MFEVTRQIDKEGETEAWLNELRDEWRLQTTAGWGFGPVPELDRFVTSNARKDKMLKLFGKALEDMANRGGAFSAEELDEMAVGGLSVHWGGELSTEGVIEVGKQFQSLLS